MRKEVGEGPAPKHFCEGFSLCASPGREMGLGPPPPLASRSGPSFLSALACRRILDGSRKSLQPWTRPSFLPQFLHVQDGISLTSFIEIKRMGDHMLKGKQSSGMGKVLA